MINDDDCDRRDYNRVVWLCHSRAEKSEVLSEDLQSVEKRVDQVKHAAQATSKKIAMGLQGTGADMDKRLVSYLHVYNQAHFVCSCRYSLHVRQEFFIVCRVFAFSSV